MEHNTIGNNRIPFVLETKACDKHKVPVGVPCWHIRAESKWVMGYMPAVCNDRAKRAGFTQEPSEGSLNRHGSRPASKKSGHAR